MTDPIPKKLRRSDIKRIEQAARNRWPMPDAVREAAITRLAMIVADPKQRPRTHVAAVRALAELDKINVAKEAVDQRAEQIEESEDRIQVIYCPGDVSTYDQEDRAEYLKKLRQQREQEDDETLALFQPSE